MQKNTKIIVYFPVPEKGWNCIYFHDVNKLDDIWYFSDTKILKSAHSRLGMVLNVQNKAWFPGKKTTYGKLLLKIKLQNV